MSYCNGAIPFRHFDMQKAVNFVKRENNLKTKAYISLNMNFYTAFMQMTLLSFSKTEIL